MTVCPPAHSFPSSGSQSAGSGVHERSKLRSGARPGTTEREGVVWPNRVGAKKHPVQGRWRACSSPTRMSSSRTGGTISTDTRSTYNTGTSGLVLARWSRRGESSRQQPVSRHDRASCGDLRHGAGTGGLCADYASKRNLHNARAHGATDMVFARKGGAPGVYGKLRCFRAGIEGRRSRISSGASAFAGATGGGSITFGPACGSAIVAHNRVALARSRLQLKPT